jgi:hypothetical protein
MPVLMQELLAATYAYTKRPDKGVDTLQAIKFAILKMHGRDQFIRDLTTTNLIPVRTNYSVHSLENLFPRYRRLYKATLHANESADSRKVNIKIKDQLDTLTTVFNGHNVSISGDELRIHLAGTPTTEFVSISAFSFPVISDTVTTSWIAQNYMECVVCEAASKIFTPIGKLDEARHYRAQSAEVWQQVLMDNVVAEDNF